MSSPQEVTYWYRVEDITYAAPVDEFDNPIGSGRTEVVMRRYEVVKTTPKGVWLRDFVSIFGTTDSEYKGKFVLRDARKRWACPTTGEAIASFEARKRKLIKICQARINRAELCLRISITEQWSGKRLGAVKSQEFAGELT
jgi:hypothetical protein